MTEIRELVRTFVVDNFVLDPDSENFTDETDLKESGILDSLAMLKLITFVEDQFKIELEANDLESDELSSVAHIENLVKSRRKLQPKIAPRLGNTPK